ncbi:MAG: glycosyltransferase family 2 protein [Pirellulaceae bacterium]
MPKISVVMACYNGMPYLPDSIDSIVNQSFTDWELIVVNDGSTDSSADYLQKRAEADSRIRVEHQTNQGQQAAANRGIELAEAELIARMDADDISALDRLEKQIAFMDANPEVGILGGQITRMGRSKSGLPSNLPVAHNEIVTGLLHNHHTFCNGTCVFRKHLFEEIGGYWKHDIAEDWDMFLRMAEVSRISNLPDVLLSCRLHTSSINGRRIVEAQLFNEFAAHLARLRARGAKEITFEEFHSQHRCQRWPASWSFYLDSLSIGQYREAVAEIYNGSPMKGYSRLALAMSMSPARTLRRALNMFSRK